MAKYLDPPRKARKLIPILAGLLFLSACSSEEVQVAPPDQEALVAGFVEQGLSKSVATCVVGWSDRLELEPVDPGADREPADQLIIDEAIANCVAADALVNPEEGGPERLAFGDEPFTFGDDLELDVLWTQCEGGDGRSCDRLWEQAPIGSEYEEFGVTCGQRLDLLDCTEELSNMETP